MTIGVPVRFVVVAPGDLVPCFDATASDVFATACHLVDGDRDDAETLLIDVYMALRDAVEGGESVDVDHEWIVATALRQVLGEQPDGTTKGLTARERAVIELHLIDGADIESVAQVLGLTPDEVLTSLARADGSIDDEAFSTALVDDLLRRSELWLDDTTRRRARAALRVGCRTGSTAPPVHNTRRAEQPTGDPVGRQPPDQPWHVVTARPRPRRRSIVFVSLVVLAVAAGAIAISPGHRSKSQSSSDVPSPASTEMSSGVSSPQSSAATSTSISTASDPSATTTTERDSASTPGINGGGRTPSLPAGFVLDRLPTGFEAAGSDETIDPPLVGRFQVWAEPDATRSSGRWLAISTMATAFTRTAIIAAGARETIGFSPAVITFDTDGIAVITVQPPDVGQFSITGGGFSPDELRQLAAGITLVRGEATFDPALDTLRADLPLIHDVAAEPGGMPAQVMDGPRRTTTFVETAGNGYIDLTTQLMTPDDLRISELVLPPSTDTLASSTLNRTVQMGPLELLVGSAPPSGLHTDGRSSVRWHVGSETITMAGNVGLYQLLGAVDAVRTATPDEWLTLLRMGRSDLATPSIGSDEGLIRIGRTTIDDNSHWTVAVLAKPLTIQFALRNYSVNGIMGELPLDVESLHPVHEFVSMSSTSVVVAITNPDAATGVRITVAGRSPTTLPLVPIADTGIFAAALTFRDISPYTVALVDDAGVVVQVLTP
ncbi:MAG: hypothetical protein ABIR32_19650 [Ilumatobacteraceae bacterium]